jgi:hypothetical protein
MLIWSNHDLNDHHVVPELRILMDTNSCQVIRHLTRFATSLDPDPFTPEVAVFSGQRVVRRTTPQAQASRYFTKPVLPRPDEYLSGSSGRRLNCTVRMLSRLREQPF